MKLELNIKGMDKVVAGMSHLNGHMSKYMVYAGREAADEVLDTQGLREYPPNGPKPAMQMTDKQRRGYFAKLNSGEIEVPYRRGQSPGSEKYGSQWYIAEKKYGVKMGNRASYAGHLTSNDQANYMAGLGWRKLWDVAKEKKDRIQSIFQAWVDKLIQDAGL